MMNKFPKTRPTLPEKFRKIYDAHIMQNREGATKASHWSKKAESWMHRQVASDISSTRPCKTTLEIGAGTLNQLPYEPQIGPYDVIEPFKHLYQGSPLLGRIRSIYSDIQEVPGKQRYDRISSLASFEHICNLPEVIARSGLMLNQKGTLRVAIPSEGTFLWSLGWRFFTGLEFRIRYGLDYSLLMKHEHVNSAKEIEALLHYFFDDIQVNVFGLSKGVSFYQFYQCAEPRIKQCHDYLPKNGCAHVS